MPKHTQRSLLFENDITNVGPWSTFIFLMIILFHPFTLFFTIFYCLRFYVLCFKKFLATLKKKKKKNVIVALQLNFELCKLKTKKNKKRRSEVRDFRIEQIIPNS